MDAVQQDKCWGRRLARVGVNPTTRSTRAPDTVERVTRWRWLARQPGLGTHWQAHPHRKPVPDCPQPDPPEIRLDQIIHPAAAAAAPGDS